MGVQDVGFVLERVPQRVRKLVALAKPGDGILHRVAARLFAPVQTLRCWDGFVAPFDELVDLLATERDLATHGIVGLNDVLAETVEHLDVGAALGCSHGHATIAEGLSCEHLNWLSYLSRLCVKYY